MSVLSAKYMHDEAAAFEHVEAMLWPDGPVCPHCGVIDNAYVLKGVRSKPSKKNPEGKERHGLKKCKDCGKQFTIRVGTIFESSHIEMHLWLQAIYMMTSSKKGISSNQLHRTLGITLKSAWFMSHRIREAMRVTNPDMFGTGGGIVEADETFIGNIYKKPKKHRAYAHKHKILSLLDRDTGRTRSVVVDDLKATTIMPILVKNIEKEARIVTDEAQHYNRVKKHFAKHGTVTHSVGEYVSAFDREIHTNTIEGFFSIFKRGMKGVYQHCNKRHLHRYTAEFEFRYNNREINGFDDSARANEALFGVIGKRVLYRDS